MTLACPHRVGPARCPHDRAGPQECVCEPLSRPRCDRAPGFHPQERSTSGSSGLLSVRTAGSTRSRPLLTANSSRRRSGRLHPTSSPQETPGLPQCPTAQPAATDRPPRRLSQWCSGPPATRSTRRDCAASRWCALAPALPRCSTHPIGQRSPGIPSRPLQSALRRNGVYRASRRPAARG